jgi:flagellar protein FliO/FliZ
MTQSLILIFVFVGLLACMPMAINRLKKRYGLTQLGPTHESRVVSVVAVGPQQKVVTVEVGPPEGKVWLVLGVTAHSVNHLHTLPPGSGVPDAQTPTSGTPGAATLIAP